MADELKLIALSGSLRRDSLNTALLRAASELAPAGMRIELYDYRDVPFFDADLDLPDSVAALKQAISDADGVLIGTPEYNHSIPGVLKNALDWASRPAFRSPFAGKPVGIVTASPGGLGGVRAHAHLQNVLLGMAAHFFPHPGVAVARARDKFEDGLLTDEATRRFLSGYLSELATFVAEQRRTGGPA